MSIITSPAEALCASLPNNIVMRRFVAETVLMDVNAGRYFRLDRTGGAMLDALVRAPTVRAAAALLSDDGWGAEAEVHSDLETLARELAGMGLIRLHTD